MTPTTKINGIDTGDNATRSFIIARGDLGWSLLVLESTPPYTILFSKIYLENRSPRTRGEYPPKLKRDLDRLVPRRPDELWAVPA